MKPILSLIIFLTITACMTTTAQYYHYSHDSHDFYYDDTPQLILQHDPVMNGWYVADTEGKRISDYYSEIRPFSQGAAAAHDNIMGWCFIDLSGKRVTDYYEDVDDFREGCALVKDKIMGWTFINPKGERIVNEYFKEAYPFHRGVALVRDQVMGWYLLNRLGKRITDYHQSPRDLRRASRTHIIP